MTFDLLKEWPEVQKRKVEIPQALALREWIKRETKLGNPVLEAEVKNSGDPVLKQALDWSKAVNAAVADIVHHVPPFPFVRESLQKVSEWADIIVCSATPYEALRREWEEHDIAKYTQVIAGQEMGSKKEHIQFASAGRYDKDKVLMIGDAPGDMKAAQGNDAKFFPVNPGEEEKSWELFYKDIAAKFNKGTYSREVEQKLIQEFDRHLPDVPPWKK
jgi:phosphoglycolate phosphatase-like HAD superfamily hydrolase